MKKRAGKDEDEAHGKRRKLLLATGLIAVIVLILASVLVFLRPVAPPLPSAAIIDQLSSSQLADPSRYPNQTFVGEAKTLLQTRFSKIDYYSDNATVDQYKALPTRGYKFIIWRAHSALDLTSKYVAICTTEKYGAKNYNQYLENGQLTLCNISFDPNWYFGITPLFVREAMSGSFEDTVIVFMSCNGLKNEYYSTASAFTEKGVKAFVSWDGFVDPSDNDNGVSLFLHRLIDGNSTIQQAALSIQYSSDFGLTGLNWYPPEAGSFRVPDYRSAHSAEARTLIIVAPSERGKVFSGSLLGSDC